MQQGGVVESVVSGAGWSCRASGQCSRIVVKTKSFTSANDVTAFSQV